jgi:hypothetical protein
MMAALYPKTPFYTISINDGGPDLILWEFDDFKRYVLVDQRNTEKIMAGSPCEYTPIVYRHNVSYHVQYKYFVPIQTRSKKTKYPAKVVLYDDWANHISDLNAYNHRHPMLSLKLGGWNYLTPGLEMIDIWEFAELALANTREIKFVGFYYVTKITDDFLRNYSHLRTLDLSSFVRLRNIGNRFLYGCKELHTLKFSTSPSLRRFGTLFLCTGNYIKNITWPDGWFMSYTGTPEKIGLIIFKFNKSTGEYTEIYSYYWMPRP